MASAEVVDTAPFRSRRGRTMALALAAASVVIFVAIGLLLGGVDSERWTPGNRLFMVMIGLGLAAGLWRWAVVEAVPDERGLSVRNLLGSRHIEWHEIREVTFGPGDPWLSLHLTDTDTVAVMAIQRADGDFARSEARRLAGLVASSRSAA